MRWFESCALVLVALLIGAGGLSVAHAARSQATALSWDVVFVARAHLATRDNVFRNEVGPAGEFGTGLMKFAPGSKLAIRHPDGSLTTLVEGSNPTAATGFLIDVQDVLIATAQWGRRC